MRTCSQRNFGEQVRADDELVCTIKSSRQESSNSADSPDETGNAALPNRVDLVARPTNFIQNP